MADDDWADNVADRIRKHVDENFPKGVSVPTGVSEDEAVRAVQEQFTKAGFGCPEKKAREIVRKAWESNK
jgi:hypothetical protein